MKVRQKAKELGLVEQHVELCGRLGDEIDQAAW
jgi:hypothetical protein